MKNGILKVHEYTMDLVDSVSGELVETFNYAFVATEFDKPEYLRLINSRMSMFGYKVVSIEDLRL